MPTPFTSLANNALCRLRAAHASASGTFALAAGYGPTLAAGIAAAGFPPVSAAAPLRFTVVRNAALNENTQITDPSQLAVYTATGLDTTTSTLTGAVAVEGTTDLSFEVGDLFAVWGSAGQFAAIQAAVNNLETGSGSGSVTSVGLTMPGGFSVGGSPVTGGGTLAVTTALSGVVKASGGAFAAAVAGTDYVAPSTLSAWAGSTNLTTLGTVTAGTWHGSVVEPAYTGTGTPGAGKYVDGGTGAWTTLPPGDGAGTVTSVGLGLPAELTVAGSPVTSSGTLSATWASQSANRVFAGPAAGGAAAPGFRALVAADVPTIAQNQVTGLTAALAALVPQTTTVNGHALSANVTVTKSDVSLGSVENTALSTWAGSTNLTTLGTVATGVWHGSSLGPAYIGTGTPASGTYVDGGTGAWTALPSGGGGGGSGTVTSVGLTMPGGLSVSGSPVTSAGTLAVTTALSGIVKASGGNFTAAAAGTDYVTPTGSITGNAATATALTGILATGKLLGGQGTGVPAAVTVGSGLSLSGGTLTATGGGGGAVPAGGAAGAALTKVDGTDYNAGWVPGVVNALAFGTVPTDGTTDAAPAIQAIIDAHPGRTIYLPTIANPPIVGGVLQPSYRLNSTPSGNPDGVGLYLRETGTKLIGDGYGTLLKCGPRITGVWSAGYGQEVVGFAIYGSSPWAGGTGAGAEQAVIPVGQFAGLTRLAGGDDSDGLRVSNLNSKFSRLILEGHGRDGINCSAHDQNLPGSSGAEDCTFDTIFTQNNRRHGVKIEGGDSNVNAWINVSCNVNGGWGFQNLSFLGQSFYGAQVNQNGWDSTPYVSGDLPQALTAITRDSGGTVTATFASPHGFVAGDALELRYCPDSTFLGRWPIASAPSSTTVTWQQAGRSAATPSLRAPVTTTSTVNGPTRVPVASTTGIGVGMHVLGPYAFYLGPGREDVVVDAVDVVGSAVILSTTSVNGGAYPMTYCDAAAVRNILSLSRSVLSATRVVTPPTVTPTITTTLGSPTVAVSSTAGIVVGMTIRAQYVDGVGVVHLFFDQETTVTAIGSGTITVSRPAIYARTDNPSTIGYDYWQNSGTCLTTLVFNGAYRSVSIVGNIYPLVVGHGLSVYNTGDLSFDGTFICISVDTDGSGNTRVTYPQQGATSGTVSASGFARLAVPEDSWAVAQMTGGGYYSGNVTASTSPNVWMNCYAEGNQPWRLGDADWVMQPIGGNKIYGGDVHLAQIGGLGFPGGTRGHSIQATRDGDEVVYRRIGVTTAGAYTELYQDPTRVPGDAAATLWGWKTSPSAVGLYHGDPASATALLQATSTGVAFTGVPTAPTATTGTNTTQLATCAFVLANAGGGGGGSPGGSSGQLQYDNAGAFGGTAAGAYAASGALFTFTALAATDTPLVVKGAGSQSANLVEVRNSSSTALFNCAPDGSVTTNPGTAQSVRVGPLPGDPSYGGVWVGQSSPGSSNYALLAQTGATLFNGTTGLSFRAGNLAAMFVDANGGTPRTVFSYLPDATFGDTSAVVSVVTADAALKGLAVRGRASQTGNLLEFQSSTPATLSAFRPDGSWAPPHLADSAAANDSLYYSTTQSKLCYKDSGGTSNPLY